MNHIKLLPFNKLCDYYNYFDLVIKYISHIFIILDYKYAINQKVLILYNEFDIYYLEKKVS